MMWLIFVRSIKPINSIEKDLLLNVKKVLENGTIIFINENSYNLNELGSTINYIKSRGYNIVNINQLLDWFYVDVNDIISL